MLFSGRQDARFSRSLAASRRAALRPTRSEGTPLLRRTTIWVTTALCLALVLATLGEIWVRIGIEQQAAQVRSQNAQLRQDVQSTQQAVTDARSAATIEREARAWGYMRPGDNPVLIVTEP